jgi:hypothetical protein
LSAKNVPGKGYNEMHNEDHSGESIKCVWSEKEGAVQVKMAWPVLAGSWKLLEALRLLSEILCKDFLLSLRSSGEEIPALRSGMCEHSVMPCDLLLGRFSLAQAAMGGSRRPASRGSWFSLCLAKHFVGLSLLGSVLGSQPLPLGGHRVKLEERGRQPWTTAVLFFSLWV